MASAIEMQPMVFKSTVEIYVAVEIVGEIKPYPWAIPTCSVASRWALAFMEAMAAITAIAKRSCSIARLMQSSCYRNHCSYRLLRNHGLDQSDEHASHPKNNQVKV